VDVGYHGRVGYSTDGISWTSATQTLGTSDIMAIAYGGGRFVAGGYKKVAYSNKQE
jgi:hypothetical protein